MNLKNNHPTEKPVSAVPLFKGEGISTALQIVQNQQLKEHTTKVPALLICVIGEVIFENENGTKETLQIGDYINIEPNVKHWVTGNKDSQLLLLK
jgi:quercetin dioxygenase-like cupin family protein